jgi:hypothetical protein
MLLYFPSLNLISFYLILFYLILSYLILFYLILCNRIVNNHIKLFHNLSYRMVSYMTSPYHSLHFTRIVFSSFRCYLSISLFVCSFFFLLFYLFNHLFVNLFIDRYFYSAYRLIDLLLHLVNYTYFLLSLYYMHSLIYSLKYIRLFVLF